MASEGWRFAVGMGQSSGSHTAFRDRQGNYEGIYERSVQSNFRYSETNSLILEIINAPKNDWGLSAGVQIDFERKFEGGDAVVTTREKDQVIKQENFNLAPNEDRLQEIFQNVVDGEIKKQQPRDDFHQVS